MASIGSLVFMIDLVQLRREPDFVKEALSRRGISTSTMDEIIALDVEHRRLLQEAERLRAEVKDLSRQVGEARRNKDTATAETLTEKVDQLGSKKAQRAPRLMKLAQIFAVDSSLFQTFLHQKFQLVKTKPKT